ncbi:glycosyltransferase family 4 protein [bacterium]|nr:glycosyltransferase family 4 protein [bacterium]
MPLRIAFDATEAALPRLRGMARYAGELLTELAKLPEVELTLHLRHPAEVPAERLAGWGDPPSRSFFVRQRGKLDADLWHGPANRLFYRGKLPAVITLHDVAPLIGYGNNRKRVWARELKRCRAIITPSEHSRRGIIQHFGLPEERIQVIPEAASIHYQPQPDGVVEQVCAKHRLIPRRYILHVGSREKRKNPHAIFEATVGLLEEFDLTLALTGSPSQSEEQYLPRLGERVRFLGYLDDDDLPALYSGAVALLFPSFDEGFGLPAAEALACGCPALLARAGSLPEVGGEAALYFDPNEIEEVRQTLRRLLTDPELAERLRREGPKQASRRWNEVAQEHLAVYQGVVGNS